MKPEKHLLIHDLLEVQEEKTRRDATLLAGARLMRHRRWRRVAIRSSAVFVLVVAVVGIFVKLGSEHPPQIASVVPAPTAAVHYLSDDQLLALFPNTPVGLAKVGETKVLIFPRLADRERFVGQF